jgi:hypothetical protein
MKADGHVDQRRLHKIAAAEELELAGRLRGAASELMLKAIES